VDFDDLPVAIMQVGVTRDPACRKKINLPNQLAMGLHDAQGVPKPFHVCKDL